MFSPFLLSKMKNYQSLKEDMSVYVNLIDNPRSFVCFIPVLLKIFRKIMSLHLTTMSLHLPPPILVQNMLKRITHAFSFIKIWILLRDIAWLLLYSSWKINSVRVLMASAGLLFILVVIFCSTTWAYCTKWHSPLE